ncbi:MAG: hypothetical protein CBD03_01380 [Rhizobiales bacterium TMED143]|nr:hypothetical protein [Rhodobiaceae bacterium]OUV92876.1 MAG: hypothetical protein CBD03_01380 [Rhizobiales bacterium TMED143]CAI8300117.1 MAG: Uncharacterised protein [Rhodobiaceae bacterium UBA7378]HCQ81756.1 hypothetical protein [Rhodobiaceae bacterium]|tara:strand:- start:248 stop:616 length:369 start_codon:yes stop_codon:yes gene_type:complete
MSKQIQVFYELEVLDGKADELRDIARQMVAYNQEGEPGTLVYNVYMSDDEKLLTFMETWADSEAGIFHAERFAKGNFVGQVLERTGNARLCFYGNASDDMKNWATENGFAVEYATPIDGFVR